MRVGGRVKGQPETVKDRFGDDGVTGPWPRLPAATATDRPRLPTGRHHPRQANGVFDGFPDNTSRPNDPIDPAPPSDPLRLRRQPRRHRTARPPFTDVTLFYDDAVKWAKAKALADGFPDNTFRQNNNINRGNASRTFYNTAQTPAAWADTMTAPPNMLFRNNLAP